jgi:hypothetical protein
MLCYEYFNGDTNESLFNMQHEMYTYSVSSIIEKIKSIYLDNRYTALYLTPEEVDLYRTNENEDHRLIQSVHDINAAVFRYKHKIGEFEKELFDDTENDALNYFGNIYIDTDFLQNIPNTHWHLTLKWHKFLIETLSEKFSVVKELVMAILVYPNSEQHNSQDCWVASYNAARLLKEDYPEIPWRVHSEDKIENQPS